MIRITHEQALELCRDRSMFNDERWDLLRRTIAQGLPPGFVMEFGVAQGGVTGYLALQMPYRHIEGYCRFEKGATAPVEKDGESHLQEGSMGGTTREQVFNWLTSIHVHQMVHLIQKDLRDLSMFSPPRIALAVIDVNLYEPTKECLRFTLAGLQPGGVILVDDVDYPGVARALDECGSPWQRDGYMAVLRKPGDEG